MCIGACHACTASHCDLRDPGWGDPGFRLCDFFCLAPVGPSGDVFGFVLLLLQWMACSVRGTQAAWSLRFSPVVHDAFIPLFLVFVVPLWLVSFCGFLLWFVLFLLCVVLFFVSSRFLCGMTSYGLAPRIHEACHSIGFTCSN